MVKIQDLAPVLMDRYGLDKDDAEQFFSQMFGLVADELNSSQKSVKIKGLGTFKVTSVNSRESVDVNTGERIVISGRNKISFAPDVVMRDRVNRPFAQFETVVVNDGVDFSEIDKLTDAELLEQRAVDDSCTTAASGVDAHSEAEDAAASPQAPEEHPQNTDEENGDMESVAQMSDNGNEDAESEKKDAEVESEEDDKPQQSVLQEEQKAKSGVVVPAPQAVPQSGPSVYDGNGSGESKVSKRKCAMFCLFAAMFVLLFCACGFGIYYMYDLIRQRNEKIELLERKVVQIQKASENAETTLGKKQKNSQDGQASALQPVEIEGQKADTTNTVSKHEVTAERLPDIDYKSDPRLRTGAYIIIGVERVVEVKKGQTLESISKTYLGNGMECYVEALNSRKEVSPGDKLKIPKLKWKKRSR